MIFGLWLFISAFATHGIIDTFKVTNGQNVLVLSNQRVILRQFGGIGMNIHPLRILF